MHCAWPTVHPRVLAGKNANKRKPILAPFERRRVATVSCFTKNAKLLKALWNLFPSLFDTAIKPTVSISQWYSPFSAFCLFSRGCVTNWADTMKSTERQTFSHRLTRVSNRHRQSFSSNLFQIPKTKVSLFAASLSLREVLVVLESFPANGTEFWKPHPAQPMQLGTLKRVWLNSARILTGPVIRCCCCCCFVCCGRRGFSARSENARWGYPTQFQQWRNFPQKFQTRLGFLCWMAEFGTGNAFHLRNTARLYMDKNKSCCVTCLKVD